MSQKLDGRFEAQGREVFRRPLERQSEKGRAITMGFRLCEVDEWVSEEAAEEIAKALNAALDRGEIA